MADHGVLGGYDLARDYSGMEDCLLVCATETKTESDLDRYVEALGAALASG
jgi:glycine dehydrogenase subunit 1